MTTDGRNVSSEIYDRYREGAEKFSLARRHDWRKATQVLSDSDREFLTDLRDRMTRAAGRHALVAANAGYACILSDGLKMLDHDGDGFNEEHLSAIVDALMAIDYDDDGVTDEEVDRFSKIQHSIDWYRNEHLDDIAGEARELMEAYVLGPDLGDPEALLKLRDDETRRQVEERIADRDLGHVSVHLLN